MPRPIEVKLPAVFKELEILGEESMLGSDRLKKKVKILAKTNHERHCIKH